MSDLSIKEQLNKLNKFECNLNKRTGEYWKEYLKYLEGNRIFVTTNNNMEEKLANNYIELMKKVLENKQWESPSKESSTDFTEVKKIIVTSYLNTNDLITNNWWIWSYGGIYIEVDGYFVSKETVRNQVIFDGDMRYKEFRIEKYPDDANMNLSMFALGGLFIPKYCPITDRIRYKSTNFLTLM